MRNGLWSLFEQGLGSCSNQMISIVVARSIAPEGYGAFTLAFSILLMAGVLYYALMVEPMMVFGSGKYAGCFQEYLRLLGFGHWMLTGSLTVVLAICSIISSRIGNLGVGAAFGGAALALPFSLYLLLLRPACYVRDKVQIAAIGSFLNLVLSTIGLAVLYLTNNISTLAAFGVIATAAGGACAFVRTALTTSSKPALNGQAKDPCERPTIRGVLRDHYSFGGANMLAALAFLASGQLMPLALIPVFIGLQAEAMVGAVSNLFGPLNLLMRSAAVLLLPQISRHTHIHGLDAKARRYLLLAAAAFASVAAIYGAMMITFGRPIMHDLYRGQYGHSAALILIFGINYVASSIEQVLALGLKAIRRVRTLVYARSAAALIAPLVAVPALLAKDLTWVIAAFALGYVIAGAIITQRMLQYDKSLPEPSSVVL